MRESTVALVIGLAALVAAWTMPHPAGVVFIGAIAAHTFGRQLLFPFRTNPRHTSHGRTITMALAALVVAIDIGVAVFR
jgi:phosphatidylglycerol:prolipoprotein diacylglycerol transferase